jgi:hypothetical protein
VTASCPKCGRARAPGAAACARCGLVYARWSGEAPGFAPLDDEGARLWAGVEGAWQQEEMHDRFVKHCAAAGRLGAAGRQYRDALDRAPGDAIALRMQQRIVAMASLALGPPAAQRASAGAGGPVTRSRFFLLFVGLAVLAGALGGLIYAR